MEMKAADKDAPTNKKEKKFQHWSISLRDHYIMNAPAVPDWYMEHERNQEVRHCTWPVWWADRMIFERKERYHFVRTEVE